MSLRAYLLSLPVEEEDDDDGAAAVGGKRASDDRAVPLNDESWHTTTSSSSSTTGGSPTLKKARTSELGIGINDDYFVVPELQRRPLPREDGYMEDEKDAWVARTRPFGKDYLNEQEEREKILAQNKNYRFMREVAGALRKDPLLVVEEEDLARVMRERAQERREAEAELRRTRLTIDEKSVAVRKIETLLVDVRTRYDRAQHARPVPLMQEMSLKLIGRESPAGLLHLVNQIGEYALLDAIRPGELKNPVHAVEMARLEHFDDGENEELQEAFAQFAASMPRQYYTFFVYVFYRDFLDNESGQGMRESFAAKSKYAASAWARLGVAGDEKTVAEPEILQKPDPARVTLDWSRYLNTETLQMDNYARLGLMSNVDKLLISRLAGAGVYSEWALAAMMGFIFDAGARPDLARPEYARLQPLLQRTENRSDTALRLLLRSHLLWLHYNEVGLTDLVNVLFDQQGQDDQSRNVLRSFVVEKIQRVVSEILPPLRQLLDTVYVPLVDTYLEGLADYLREQRGIVGQAAVFRLADGRPGLLMESQEEYRQTDSLVQDALFRAYLRRGDAVFRVPQATTTESTEAPMTEAPPDQYPVLVLHLLFRQYQRFLAAYLVFGEQEIQAGELALAKARDKMNRLLGDERVDRADRSDPRLYQQRKSFTTQPINSGFIKFKAEIKTLIDRAWHNTQLYCEKLRGLPLAGFHCEAAFESGLCSRFCEYVGALYAYKDLAIQQQYNSQHHTAHCHKALWEAFHPLHAFSWQPLYDRTPDGDAQYHIIGGSPTGGGWPLVSAAAQYSLAPF
jgi:hypothetical protein